ncbi:MAG: BrnA antitoxin family protein [Acidobacteria bacterium]|nr:BrnA antitoxin family protein [Acidobacteriota bacterium]
MKTISKRKAGTPTTAEQRRQLAAAAKMPESRIDTSDAPELPAETWKDAMRGRFYRPVKQAVSLRLDADVLAWLKKDGEGYQTRANQMLRERMLKDCEL